MSIVLRLLAAPKDDENCVNRKSDGKWESKKCDEKKTFLCYEEKLILVKENKTWEEALEHCRSLDGVVTEDPASSYRNHGYDLASLITPDDYTTARETAKEATTDEVGQFSACVCVGERLITILTVTLFVSLCLLLAGVDRPV